jgi:pimeloyl-ACP methyl ester carboxylesterase
MDYRLEGTGPVVIVLNGGHCSRRTRLSHKGLAAHGYTVLTPSRPGYDATPAGTGRTAQAAADALCALLDSLQVEAAHVVGISAAGPTALAFAQRHPGRTRKLILESAVTLPWEAGLKRGSRLVFGRAERLTWALVKATLRIAPAAMLRTMLRPLTTLPVEAVLRRLSPADTLFVRRMIEASQSGQGFVTDIEHEVDELSSIHAPVLALYSPHDRAVPPRHVERLRREIPQTVALAVPADTHLLWIGPHAVEVWQARLAFLAA